MSIITKPTKGIAVALTAALLSTTAASASTLQLGNITASWFGAVGGSSVNIDNSNILDPTIFWGTGSNGQSGYELEVLGDPVPVPGAAANTVFDIADFTHVNVPITAGTAITGVNLSIMADILIDGLTAVNGATFNFSFAHNETPNVANTCEEGPQTGSGVCADIVEVSILDDTSTFDFDGVAYTLSLLGFQQGGAFTEKFISVENDSSTGQLVGSFTAAVVPLPAAGWMLLAGVGGLAALRRRQKQKEA